MYVFKNNTIIPINAANVIATGEVNDERITNAEKVIASHYGVSVAALNDWRNDSQAKIMICFMLHEYLLYSIGSLAKRYRIDHLHLRLRINETYEKCLTQPAFYQTYTSLKDASFTDLINSHEPAASNVEAVGFFN